MSEPEPAYTASIQGYYEIVSGHPEIPEWAQDYLMQRRRWLIAELRHLDRLLNRPQTIPERNR